MMSTIFRVIISKHYDGLNIYFTGQIIMYHMDCYYRDSPNNMSTLRYYEPVTCTKMQVIHGYYFLPILQCCTITDTMILLRSTMYNLQFVLLIYSITVMRVIV